MLTKSLSDNVSSIADMVDFAKSPRWPVMEPELSTKITISLGDVAAPTYQELDRKSYTCRVFFGLCHTEDISSGGHAIAVWKHFHYTLENIGMQFKYSQCLYFTWISSQEAGRTTKVLPG